MTTQPPIQDNGQPEESRPVPLRSFGRSAGAKFFILGFLALLAYLPLQMVWSLQRERAASAQEASADIEKMSGGRQRISGPFIAVPYLIAASDGRQERHLAIFLPDDLVTENKVATEIRYRSIFQVPVYRNALTARARFKPVDMKFAASDGARPLWDEAALIVSVTDTRGIVSRVVADFGQEKTAEFQPGTPLGLRSGIHAPLKGIDIQKPLEISIAMQVNGASSLSLSMLGKTSLITMSSDWRHPSFQGQALPERRSIGEAGFSATWRSSPLASNIPAIFSVSPETPDPYSGDRSSSRISTLADNGDIRVDFYMPADLYQRIERTLKYGFMFIGGMFLAVFGLEMTSSGKLHAAQYVLFGLALILFYVLLLSFAEHAGFNTAYLIAAAATTALTASYIGMALRSVFRGSVFGVILAIAYTLIFMLLGSEDYALLIGSVAIFIALAALMFATLRLDWGILPGAAASRKA